METNSKAVFGIDYDGNDKHGNITNLTGLDVWFNGNGVANIKVNGAGNLELKNSIQDKANTIWVLTTQHNDYDQHGVYFVCYWMKKPDIEQLQEGIKLGMEGKPRDDYLLALAQHVYSGGGRRDIPNFGLEDQWFNLEELEPGKNSSFDI